MKNGMEIVSEDGSPMLMPFVSVSSMEKRKTEGSAYFTPDKMGKDAIWVRLNGSMPRSFWITDPAEMERVWGAYRAWIESE
jgi:hypothetical protein